MRAILNMIMIAAFLTIFVAACTNNEKKEEKALKEEVMDIHDEAMALKSRMMELLRKLEEKKATIAINIVEGDLSSVSRYESMVRQLSNAEEAMMDWMHNYKSDTDDMTHEEVMAYLENEKLSIKNVKTKMLHAIEMAEKTLEE